MELLCPLHHLQHSVLMAVSNREENNNRNDTVVHYKQQFNYFAPLVLQFPFRALNVVKLNVDSSRPLICVHCKSTILLLPWLALLHPTKGVSNVEGCRGLWPSLFSADSHTPDAVLADKRMNLHRVE